MNSEQRRALRLFLASQDFERVEYTGDIGGTCRYEETWERIGSPLELDTVVIKWGVRS